MNSRVCSFILLRHVSNFGSVGGKWPELKVQERNTSGEAVADKGRILIGSGGFGICLSRSKNLQQSK